MKTELETRGFRIQTAVLNAPELSVWQAALTPLLAASPAGLRQLGQKLPEIQALAYSVKVRKLIEPILGPTARLVRAIVFNKSRNSNWQVGWHQDLSIAVLDRVEMPGFSGWSTKEGVLHVQAPVSVLENMLTLRLHLDPADASNGALWVAPGSHRLGRITSSEASTVAERLGKVLCAAAAGDALIMRPLLLHASFKAGSEQPRRVIHLEFTGGELPPPLRWCDKALQCQRVHPALATSIRCSPIYIVV